jgi:hypothetical protein
MEITTLEIIKHRDEISKRKKQLSVEKAGMRKVLESMGNDYNNDNDAENYSYVYEYSNRICCLIKAIERLQELILLKTS